MVNNLSDSCTFIEIRLYISRLQIAMLPSFYRIVFHYTILFTKCRGYSIIRIIALTELMRVPETANIISQVNSPTI